MKTKSPKLSIILIVRDEAQMLPDCLKSVSFADEIIVLDSGSNDNTVEIAKQFTNHVFETDWPGYGVQKNRALEKATGRWVLSIDADERVTPALAQEIQQAIQQNDAAAYDIPFHSYFLGKRIRFGDWRGEHHVRLFCRDKASFDDAVVHENLNIDGAIKRLNNAMLHYSYTDQAEVDRKVENYAQAGAQRLLQKGKRGGLLIALPKAGFAFFRSYLLKLGFLDGIAGYKLAKSIAQYTYRRYRLVQQLRGNG